jgi:hypothetical protein
VHFNTFFQKSIYNRFDILLVALSGLVILAELTYLVYEHKFNKGLATRISNSQHENALCKNLTIKNQTDTIQNCCVGCTKK